jgi:uncharacterized protein (TIGR03545 family)
VLDLDPVPLFEKKLVVDRMELTGLRFGAPRKSPARPASGDGVAARLLGETKRWAQQFHTPLASFTPIDTIKSLVLNPGQLASLKAAAALSARADSVRQAFDRSYADLRIQPVLDSAKALAARLSGASPAKLGLAGVKDAASSVNQTLSQLSQAKQRLSDLEKATVGSDGLLAGGLAALDQAREQDYTLARGLLKPPSLDAPDIGAALFGPPSADRFQEALYYAQLAQKYIPPGLQPWRQSGPKRLRRAGTTVRFPKERAYPSFLLREGKIGFFLGADSTSGAISAALSGLTTQPALYGRPALLSARGATGGANPISIALDGRLNHLGPQPKDSVQVTLRGVTLPSFQLPGLPFTVDPGRGEAALSFGLDGERLSGRWTIHSSQAAWSADTARLGRRPIETAIWAAVSGLRDLAVNAQLSGTISAPRLSVSTNLDQAISGRLKQVFGEQVANAEARARAEVDRLVSDKLTPVKGQVAQVQTDLTRRLGSQEEQLDQVTKQLQGELKRMAGPAGGLLKLP